MSSSDEKGSPGYQLFMLVLSIYVLLGLAAETLFISDPEISGVLQFTDLVVCAFFFADFLVNLYLAKSKLGYMKWGWIDLLASVPLIDPLRWGRLARIIRIIRFLRAAKSVRFLWDSMQQSKIESFSLVVFLLLFVSFTCGSLLILDFEREAGGTINTANEALWWAFLNILNAKVAVTQAVSVGGITVTVILNKVGLLLFAYINAIFIAWLLQKKDAFVVGGRNENS